MTAIIARDGRSLSEVLLKIIKYINQDKIVLIKQKFLGKSALDEWFISWWQNA